MSEEDLVQKVWSRRAADIRSINRGLWWRRHWPLVALWSILGLVLGVAGVLAVVMSRIDVVI